MSTCARDAQGAGNKRSRAPSVEYASALVDLSPSQQTHTSQPLRLQAPDPPSDADKSVASGMMEPSVMPLAVHVGVATIMTRGARKRQRASTAVAPASGHMLPAASSAHVYSTGARAVQMPLTDGPLRGLDNLGNTCYLNAILQSMMHVPSLTAAAEQHWDMVHTWRSHNAADCMVCCLRHLRVDAAQRGPPAAIAPGAFRNAAAKLDARFHDGQQQDASEMLLTIMQPCIKQCSEIGELLEGMETPVTVCSVCKKSCQHNSVTLGPVMCLHFMGQHRHSGFHLHELLAGYLSNTRVEAECYLPFGLE